MAVGTIAVSAGTFTTPPTTPTSGDGTTIDGKMTTGGLVASTANTAAGTGDLDCVQGLAWSVGGFAEYNQFVGLAAAAWSCTPQAANLRIMEIGRAYRMAAVQVPTGG
jgi:hypothetical protein